MPEPVMYSASQVAKQLKTDPKTLRKFLRDPKTPYSRVGQGGRYQFAPEQVSTMAELFEEWSSNHLSRTKRTDESTVPRARTSRASKEVNSAIDVDDLKVRLNSSIGARQRRHGVICSWQIKTRVGTVIELCTEKAIPGTKYCRSHEQKDYCGEMDNALCGPEHKQPYCKWHAGDISEAELEALLRVRGESV